MSGIIFDQLRDDHIDLYGDYYTRTGFRPCHPLMEYKELSNFQLSMDMIERFYKLKGGSTYIFGLKSRETGKLSLCLLEFSEFESAIFGFKVGRVSNIISEDMTEGNLYMFFREFLCQARKAGYTYLTMSVNHNDGGGACVINSSIKSGFRFIANLVTFGFKSELMGSLDLSYRWDSGVNVRYAKPEDAEELYRIAMNSFTIDKYHLDSCLPKAKCDALYAESTRNSLLHGYSDRVFVAEYDKRVIGFCTGNAYPYPNLSFRLGRSGNGAIDHDFRSLGAYKALTKIRIESFAHDTTASEYGTYFCNYPVQAVYIYSKMRIVRGVTQLSCFIS